MTQRSQQRWNTGKRGAAMRRMERFGEFYARRKWHMYENRWGIIVGFRKLSAEAIVHFHRSPNLSCAFRRGAWKWVESQPVEF